MNNPLINIWLIETDLFLRKSFFPWLLFDVHIKSPNPKNPKCPHTTGPKPHQLKKSTPKAQIQDLNPKTPNPQTTITEQKWEKNVENNPRENTAFLWAAYFVELPHLCQIASN